MKAFASESFWSNFLTVLSWSSWVLPNVTISSMYTTTCLRLLANLPSFAGISLDSRSLHREVSSCDTRVISKVRSLPSQNVFETITESKKTFSLRYTCSFPPVRGDDSSDVVRCICLPEPSACLKNLAPFLQLSRRPVFESVVHGKNIPRLLLRRSKN